MAHNYNLLEKQWIPVNRKSGRQDKIAPYQITETGDPVISLNGPRADFNGALMEFLVGLLQTTVAPEDHNSWVDWLEIPPSADELQQKFSLYSHAFELSGSTPLFMQDFEGIKGEAKPVSALLIDSPGGKALKDNTDHFIKRGNVQALCESCVAMALFTLQTYAPSGGVGHRTSLRGGGPLTTLVSVDAGGSDLEENLWSNLWLNVLEKPYFDSHYGKRDRPSAELIFPWLAKTRTSENKAGVETHLQQVDPLQMYWGMPRRIKLLWQYENTHCDLCGCEVDVFVREYITKNYGVNYAGQWQHPLSPHYIEPKSGEVLPVHAHQDGLTYRHWPGWAQGTESIKSARVVQLFDNRKLENEQLQLSVSGYDMDNMKARGWHQTHYPLYLIEDEKMRVEFNSFSLKLIEAAEKIAGLTQSCIKEAWFSRPKEARGDTGFIKASFYYKTETNFYRALQSLRYSQHNKDEYKVIQSWYNQLRKTAFELFDYWAVRGDLSIVNPRRIAAAHKKLLNSINNKKFKEKLGIKHKEKAS